MRVLDEKKTIDGEDYRAVELFRKPRDWNFKEAFDRLRGTKILEFARVKSKDMVWCHDTNSLICYMKESDITYMVLKYGN